MLNIGTLRGSLLKAIEICGQKDNRLRERLLREPNLTLEKTIEYGQTSQETKVTCQRYKGKQIQMITQVDHQERRKLEKSQRKQNGQFLCLYKKVM